MASTYSTIPSLETLVLQQLAAVLRDEERLSENYRNAVVADPRGLARLSDELRRFQLRADRLHRMLNELEMMSTENDVDCSPLTVVEAA